MPELNGALKNVLTHKATKWSGVLTILLAIGGGYVEQRTHADSTSTNVDSLGVELIHVISDVAENKANIIAGRSADSSQNATLQQLSAGQVALSDKLDELVDVMKDNESNTQKRFDFFIEYMLTKERDSAFSHGGG